MFVAAFAFEVTCTELIRRNRVMEIIETGKEYGACRGVIDTQRALGRFVAVN